VAVRRYKQTSLGAVDEAAVLVRRVLPALTLAEAREFVATMASLAGSLWQIANPARESVRATTGRPQPGRGEPAVRQLLDRYVRAWQLADIEGFVRLVADDVRFSMPPLTAWFDGREAVAAFIENAIFAPARPHGIHLSAGWCNGQPAFATHEPDGQGRLVASGLQVLQLTSVDGQPLIAALVSYRDPALVIRCGLPGAR
jgi:ketosteroid isomerase-like protein